MLMKRLWLAGLILSIFCAGVNGMTMDKGFEGSGYALIRELLRIGTLAGVGLFIVGLFFRNKK